jgi:DNA segregation ATPase FtsK/SpoIIIE, S-DNA-T family
MIELLAIPCLLAAAALVPKGKTDEKKVIQEIFKNRRVGFKKGDNFIYPKFKSKHDKGEYTTYVYTLPYGLPSEAFEGLLPALKDGLNKEVEYEYDGVLKLRIFHNKLPKSWDYDESLLLSNNDDNEASWEVPIGKNHTGVLYHDFEKYCHLLCGGVTRFGKTVFMKEVFNTLMLNQSDDVEFYILDLKAGLEFYKYKAFPQVKEVACDVYEAAEVLMEITNELKKREVTFREKGYTNVIDSPIKKRTFIFVDEGAELSPNIVKDKKAKKYAEFCQAALSEIARIGGGLGYRLVYATQYPTKEAVPMQVKMNIVARMSFIAASQISSRVILDDIGAEDLPSIPGRAIYLIEKKRTVQVPYIDDKMMFKMMEGKFSETGKTRKPVDDDRPIIHGENQAPTTHS